MDVRGNGAIGNTGAAALAGAIVFNDELLCKCDIAHQERPQRVLLRNQSAFLDAACVYWLGLKARCSGQLEPEHVAQIGAMAYAECFVPRGPRLYERAKALLLCLLQLPLPVSAASAAGAVI